MRGTAKTIASVLTFGVLVLGGGVPAGGATKSLSPGEFRTVANNICRQGHQLREELVQRRFGDLAAGEKPSADQLASFVEEYRSIVQQQIDSLRSLPVPRTMAAKMKKMLSAAKTALRHVVADPTILSGSTDPFAQVTSRARALRLTECAA
jgi:hypothetical protein